MLRDRTFQEILELTAEDFPNSVITDLLRDFPADFVIRFIEIYSGQTFRVPRVETIWKNYRNKVIKETLDKKDTKEVRKQLAGYFGITLEQLSQIYYYEREKQQKVKINERKMRDSVKRIFRKEVKKTIKDTKEILFKK